MVSPLLTVDELSDALVTQHPVVLDVRWSLLGPPGREAYLAGHIPCARMVDLDRQLAAPGGAGGRHPMPATGDFQNAMRGLGVSDGSAVVVYDASNGLSAARAWWLLRYFGHQDVRLLDGGFAAWVAAGGEVASGDEPAPQPGDFVARPGGMPVLDSGQVLEVARRGVLIDARAGERYRGEVEPIDPVAGHIPGARSLPTTEHVSDDGRFLPVAQLRRRFEEAGAGEGVEVGAYCGSGVTAAHEVLAAELAGLHASLYPGSWSEWITDPDRPVATGDSP